ncbi:MAG: hypothetical protein H0V45_14915 [Actinobacteria bacterium]|nr:hypothetical protein [Actinomycetota bacterium]
MRLASLSAATLVAALVATTAASAPVADDPKTMVLQLRDLPAGFARTSARYVSNTQANRESKVKKDYAKLGRVTGYEAIFQKEATTGIINVNSSAGAYKTARGARESFAITMRAVEATREIRFRRLPLGAKIGQEARLYKATVTENGIQVDLFTVAWRFDRVYAALTGGALAGTANPTAVVALARKQQARIAAG